MMIKKCGKPFLTYAMRRKTKRTKKEEEIQDGKLLLK